MERSAANPKSKTHTSRATATLWGVIAEIGFGGVLLVWIVSPESMDHAPLGRVVSMAAVIAAMGITLIGLLVMRFSHNKSTSVRRGTAYPAFSMVAIVGYLGVMSIFVDYSGPWVLLVIGAVGTYTVARNLFHAKVHAGPSEGGET